MSRATQRPLQDETSERLFKVMQEIPAWLKSLDTQRFTGVSFVKLHIGMGPSGFLLEYYTEGEQVLLPVPEAVVKDALSKSDVLVPPKETEETPAS